MTKGFYVGSALALALTLSACGSRDEPANNFAAEDGMNATMSDSGPFADAEMRMNEAMRAAIGSDAGQNWAKKMIEHHQGAIDMSRIVLDQGASGDVATMARETIGKQQKDIENIRRLIQEGAPDPGSAELYRPAMMDMHQKMMSATGADVSEAFMRKMLEHHKGAITMSDVALQNGVSGALRAQVQKTRDDNQKETDMVEAMLAGETHHEAMAASGAAPTTAAAPAVAPSPKPAPAKTSAPAEKPRRDTPKATPKAQPAQPDTATCLPEHREAGHC